MQEHQLVHSRCVDRVRSPVLNKFVKNLIVQPFSLFEQQVRFKNKEAEVDSQDAQSCKGVL